MMLPFAVKNLASILAVKPAAVDRYLPILREASASHKDVRRVYHVTELPPTHRPCAAPEHSLGGNSLTNGQTSRQAGSDEGTAA